MTKKFKILADDVDFRITQHFAPDRKQETVIVTFAGQPGHMANGGFGTGFALKSGYDTIYVAQRYETFFRG